MTISKKRMIAVAIITTLFLLAGAMLCSSKVYAAGTYTYELSNGVTMETNKDLDSLIANPDIGSNAEYIHVVFRGIEKGDAIDLKNNTHWDGTQSWTADYDNDNVDIPIMYYGKYTLTVTTKGSSASKDFYICPKRYNKVTNYTVTTNQAIFFNMSGASVYTCGPNTWVSIRDANDTQTLDAYTLKNGLDSAYIVSEVLEPGKTYILYMWGYDPNLVNPYGDFVSRQAVVQKITMGPSTQPKIKSIKTSNVKVKKKTEWNSSKGCYDTRYYTTWKVTVTLSKKAKNNLGIEIHDGVDGIYKAAGKNKTKYTVNMKRITWDKSYKGQTMKYAVRTYNNKTCGAYSPWSAYKSVKVK